MYVSMHPNDLNTVFHLYALKLGRYYVCSKHAGCHQFIVGRDWDPDPVLQEILSTLMEDEERPIGIVLGDHRISIDPIIGCDLVRCLFAYNTVNEL